MWHELSDYRRVYKLDVFNNGEIAKSITTFEKEVNQKIPVEIRHQITHASQGFPWLLKKLCINLFENLSKGDAESILVDLDIRRLFENDLDLLSPTERTSLQIIAQKAPADWSEIIEISGIAVLNSLVYKRLIIKSGDRLNIYWDIFKDYLLTGNVPIVPFNYIPTSDVSSMLKVSQFLSSDTYISAEEIAKNISLNEGTVANIGADLVMFGVAERKGTSFKHHRNLEDFTDLSILQNLREKLGKHSLKLAIYKSHSGKAIDKSIVTETLKTCLPRARFSEKTWATYANKLTKFLLHTGYLVRVGNHIVVQDTGAPISHKERLSASVRKGIVFSAPASPAGVCEALKFIEGENSVEAITCGGYRNSLFVLKRFELVSVNGDDIILSTQSINKYGGYREAVWTSAKNEPVVVKCIEKMNQLPNVTGTELGEFIANEYNMTWTTASMQRNGNSLKQWSAWVKEGISSTSIPTPPGRLK